MKRLSLAISLLLLLAVAVPAGAEEGPDKGATRWLLGLSHGPLKIVSIRVTPDRTVTYHYMTLEVSNETGLPRDWHPLVKVLTDTNRSYVAMGFDHALEAVRNQEGDETLVPIGTTKGKIQPGQTYNTVAIFGPLDPLYDVVRVQVIGLADPIAIYKVARYPIEVEVPGVVYTQTDPESGEAIQITQGITIQDVAYAGRNEKVLAALEKESSGSELPDPAIEYWEVRERRAFEMVFQRLGDEFRADDDLITAGKEYWTVVGDVRLEREIKM